LSPTYVALDLETTGLDPAHDAITEVGAVRFDASGAQFETFQALVNPGRPIPRFVEQLTGISDDDVRTAPSIDEIREDLVAFIQGATVVGHNIGFDLAYLRHAGIEVPGPAIDTASLSRVLMPGPQARGLSELAAGLGVESATYHRALADAQAAAGVFLALQRRARELPEEQRSQLARLVALHDRSLAEVIGGQSGGDFGLAGSAIPALRDAPQWPALVPAEKPSPVLAALLDPVFRAASQSIDAFEERPQQREMASAVLEAFNRGGHYLVEAGTGVGKSLAYLLPAALHALRNGERVIVSTNTINLQEQLLTKDIPALRAILKAAGLIQDESELRASLLKGRSNYLCVRRWAASYGANMADPDFSRLAASMLLWLPETETGDRSELNLDHTEWLTWQRFSAQDADCLSRQNPYVRSGHCFLQRARKAAESAHIVVVNHALLLADIAAGGSALPPFQHLIVDEAHNLEDRATQQFGGTVSRRLLAEALEGLHRPGGRDQRPGGVTALLKNFPENSGPALAGDSLARAVDRALTFVAPCLRAIAGFLPATGSDDRVLVTGATRASPDWSDVEREWAALDRGLRQACDQAAAAARLLSQAATVEEPDAIADEIESTVRKVEEQRALLEQLVSTSDDATIVWAARDRDGLASLNSAPLDVGPTLWEELFQRCTTVIATSATLSAAGDMRYTAGRLGLAEAETLQLGSPFDYERSTLLAAFTDIPEPSARDYAPAVARAITELTLASGGRALALFTSHAAMNQAADLAREAIEQAGITLLVQGVDGSPRQLTDALRNDPCTVVFGTASFWEGVDIRGAALSMLIVARLPFAVPTDPVYRARSEQYDSPFGQYALPSAILRFRQGFGRLIRDREDRGVVAVLDSRIYQKSYGQRFVDALPRCTRVKADTATVAARAKEWLSR
jgi:DNA polymerase-3 subunit epsilon/ATP-dependent DNA helicase DinG